MQGQRLPSQPGIIGGRRVERIEHMGKVDEDVAPRPRRFEIQAEPDTEGHGLVMAVLLVWVGMQPALPFAAASELGARQPATVRWLRA